MIRGEDHDGVVRLATLLQGVEDELQLGVDEGDTGVVGLHVFAAQGVVLFPQFEAEGLVAFRDRHSRQAVPQLRSIRGVGDFVQRVEIEVAVGREERDMRFLDPAGNEEGLILVHLLLQPRGHLAGVLPVLVLLVAQPTPSVAGRRLGIELGFRRLLDLLPGLAVLPLLDRAVLGLELEPRLGHHGQLVVLETDKFVPGDLTMLVAGGVEDLANAGRPVAVLLEELRHRDGTGTLLPNVCRVVENATGLRVETVEKRSPGRTADGILAEGPAEGHRLGSELGQGRRLDGVVARG